MKSSMMKKTLVFVSLLTLSAAALAGCANPHRDDQHPHRSDAGPAMMMGNGTSMHRMMAHRHQGDHQEGQHGDHGGMHGSEGQMGHGGMGHGDMHQGMDHGGAGHQDHQHQQGHGDSPFAASHNRMMEDMHGIELTGDPDYDFVRGMIPHHQGAIEMAQVLLEHGSDPEMLALSEAVIEAQRAEIAEMEAWLDSYGEPRPADQADDIRAGYQRTNDRMMRDMQVAQSGNVDRDFVVGMIPHHEAAIDMARILLQYSEDPELRELAEAVIREQEREIREMQAWLAR